MHDSMGIRAWKISHTVLNFCSPGAARMRDHADRSLLVDRAPKSRPQYNHVERSADDVGGFTSKDIVNCGSTVKDPDDSI